MCFGLFYADQELRWGRAIRLWNATASLPVLLLAPPLLLLLLMLLLLMMLLLMMLLLMLLMLLMLLLHDSCVDYCTSR